jgi:Divergent InlB B-repeat domain
MKTHPRASWREKGGSLASVALLVVLVACGGGPSSTSVAPPNVTVSVTPASATVQTGSTQQFSASVTGTSNTAVTWSVSDVTGGNQTVGTISSTGLYAAPATIPTPSAVTVSAASAVDSSRAASAAVTVTGTIETATQTITAANGGTIMLPSGSNVTIPAGAFASGQTVTASLMTSLPTQPPSGFIVGVGPALVLSTSVPPFNTSTGNIQFVINTTSNSGLQGSAAMADLVDSTGDNFFGLAGTFDSTTNLASITVPAALMTGTNSVAVSMANLAPAYAGASGAAAWRMRKLLGAAAAPPSPGQLSWNGSAWVPYTGSCPSAGSKILVLVHGMASSLGGADASGAFGGSVTTNDDVTDLCVNQIKRYGNYDEVVGLDYDFLGDIALTSGPSFANFLNTLAACKSQIDVEAHSEGGPVAAYGITQALPQTQGLIRNFIGLGNPWEGTPAAGVGVTVQGYGPLPTAFLDLSGTPVKVAGATIQSWLNAPFAAQLQPPASSNAPGLLNSIHQNLGGLNMILACGTQPIFTEPRVKSAFDNLLGTPNDGIIPLGSCQGKGPTGENVFAGLSPQLIGPYPLNHTQLECDRNVIADVGNAVNPGGPPPTSFNLTVSTTGNGSGTVSPSPGGTSCGVGCYAYSVGTVVQLTAAANAGSTFAGWSGACSSTGACSVTMNQNQTVTASFQTNSSFNLTLFAGGNGSGNIFSNNLGTSCGNGCYSYPAGTIVQLTETPNVGSTFAGWSGACSGTGTCNVTMNQNQTVTATFNLSSSQQIGVNGANVTFLGASVSCSNTGGFFDNCTGSVSLNIGTAIQNGEVAVQMDQLTFVGANPYSAGTVPGQASFSITGGIAQGTCSAGVINTDIEVIDGYANTTFVTIGYANPPASSVPLTITCGPGT